MTSPYRVPFNRSWLAPRANEYLAQAVADGHLAADGAFSRRCSELLETETGAARALLTPSCTHALEISRELLRLDPGDEVIVPSFAFVTTANAFVASGARVVFCDVRPDTLNLDETCLEELVTPRTRAIVALHYAGVGCEMEAIGRIAEKHGLTLVEDNAHGLFARYRGRPLGSFGALATQSFHETKNFSSGEGGALLVNDAAWADRAEIIRHKGTDRARFLRGEVDKYTWVDCGSNYGMSELQAAFLWAQLEVRQDIQARRASLWQRYELELGAWARSEGIELPAVPPHCEHSSHIFFLMLPDVETRTRLIQRLRDRGILAVFHYPPLHLSPMGRSFGGREGACPVSEDRSERLLRLPMFNGMSEIEQSEVIERVLEFRC